MTIDVMRCLLVKEREVTYAEENIDSPDRIYDLCKTLGMDKAADEYIYVFCLNAKRDIVGIHEVSHGELCSAIVSPREIFKRALLNNSYGIVVAHNHPSGDPTPSDEDIKATERLKNAGDVLGIKLFDHIVVGDGRYESMMMLNYIK